MSTPAPTPTHKERAMSTVAIGKEFVMPYTGLNKGFAHIGRTFRITGRTGTGWRIALLSKAGKELSFWTVVGDEFVRRYTTALD